MIAPSIRKCPCVSIYFARCFRIITFGWILWTVPLRGSQWQQSRSSRYHHLLSSIVLGVLHLHGRGLQGLGRCNVQQWSFQWVTHLSLSSDRWWVGHSPMWIWLWGMSSGRGPYALYSSIEHLQYSVIKRSEIREILSEFLAKFRGTDQKCWNRIECVPTCT